MKSVKRYVWFGVGAAVVAIGLLSLQPSDPVPHAAPDAAAMPVLARDAQRADRIQIVHHGVILDLERRGQTWCLAQNGGYPVKQDMAVHLLDALIALRLSHPSATAHRELRVEDPKDLQANLTGIRVLGTDGAGLGAIIMADHDPAATSFAAHQLGDPRDWQAAGRLVAPAAMLDWIDPHILTLDPAHVTGATVFRGAESFAVDAEDAAGRLKMLEGMVFSDIHPTAQMLTAESGRVVFTLDGGGGLTVRFRTQSDQIWLEMETVVADTAIVPPGHWVFRYPADAASLLQPG